MLTARQAQRYAFFSILYIVAVITLISGVILLFQNYGVSLLGAILHINATTSTSTASNICVNNGYLTCTSFSTGSTYSPPCTDLGYQYQCLTSGTYTLSQVTSYYTAQTSSTPCWMPSGGGVGQCTFTTTPLITTTQPTTLTINNITQTGTQQSATTATVSAITISSGCYLIQQNGSPATPIPCNTAQTGTAVQTIVQSATVIYTTTMTQNQPQACKGIPLGIGNICLAIPPTPTWVIYLIAVFIIAISVVVIITVSTPKKNLR